MIECIFTIDYEVYGNGEGSMNDLVYQPTKQLAEIFQREQARFVNFVEVLEFEQVGKRQSDPAISDVRRQIRELHQAGHEIALHLHPQWAAARLEDRQWHLDYSEHNLCTLRADRITEIVDRAIDWLRDVLGDPHFQPVSFRAGGWLFQPTKIAAGVLAERGVKIDSSVFKGGRTRQHGLDYRPSLRNGLFWTFSADVNVPDSGGPMLEVPIHTEMVPAWRMFTAKRVGLQTKSMTTGAPQSAKRESRLSRLRDYARPFYPLKFDFCRMTLAEMTSMLETAMREDAKDPTRYWPLVAIGHSKDLEDFEAIEKFLALLKARDIPIATLESAYARCLADG